MATVESYKQTDNRSLSCITFCVGIEPTHTALEHISYYLFLPVRRKPPRNSLFSLLQRYLPIHTPSTKSISSRTEKKRHTLKSVDEQPNEDNRVWPTPHAHIKKLVPHDRNQTASKRNEAVPTEWNT
mmetsp:Transcript_17639/g.26303  ORF Transcript_17639/g.26303 Transcript_17639/m.26303 type:complete len:127 (+) Transcript_17639:364-744(+)